MLIAEPDASVKIFTGLPAGLPAAARSSTIAGHALAAI